MHSSLLVALGAIAFTSAAPLTEGSHSDSLAILVARADPTPVSCGPSENLRAWPLQSVEDAYQALKDNDGKPTKPAANGRAYPRQFGGANGAIDANRDPGVANALKGITGCEPGQAMTKYFEFPITDPPFAGCDTPECQGPDRVLAIAPNVGPGQARSFTYCLAITHRGQTASAATSCSGEL